MSHATVPRERAADWPGTAAPSRGLASILALRHRENDGQPSEIVQRKDLIVGTVIAIIMANVFVFVGGKPLAVTFVPALGISWLIFARMYITRAPLPQANTFFPIYFALIAWQFIHFTEEFLTGFNDRFPTLYGTAPYSPQLFVGINMVSYFVFVVAFLLAFTRKLRFFLIPVLFFIVYGAMGNAVSHTWWVVLHKSYFPGFFTALPYLILGPLTLSKLLGSKRDALIAMACLASILIPLITVFRQAS